MDFDQTSDRVLGLGLVFLVLIGCFVVLRPFLTAILWAGVLGGAIAFGFIGIFLGPTLLAVGYRLLLEWIETPAEPQRLP